MILTSEEKQKYQKVIDNQKILRGYFKKIIFYGFLQASILIVIFLIEFFSIKYYEKYNSSSLFQIEKIQNPFLSKAIPIALFIICNLILYVGISYCFKNLIRDEIREINKIFDNENSKNPESLTFEHVKFLSLSFLSEETLHKKIVSLDASSK